MSERIANGRMLWKHLFEIQYGQCSFVDFVWRRCSCLLRILSIFFLHSIVQFCVTGMLRIVRIHPLGSLYSMNGVRSIPVKSCRLHYCEPIKHRHAANYYGFSKLCHMSTIKAAAYRRNTFNTWRSHSWAPRQFTIFLGVPCVEWSSVSEKHMVKFESTQRHRERSNRSATIEYHTYINRVPSQYY